MPGWLRSICVCARYMRALRSEALCHIISQWRGTAAELHGCCVRESTVLLLVCQHIDLVGWGSSAGTKSGSRAHFLVVHHLDGARLEKRIV